MNGGATLPCDCDDFKQSFPQIELGFGMAWTRGWDYKGVYWSYCPWCGKPLPEKLQKDPVGVSAADDGGKDET